MLFSSLCSLARTRPLHLIVCPSNAVLITATVRSARIVRSLMPYTSKDERRLSKNAQFQAMEQELYLSSVYPSGSVEVGGRCSQPYPSTPSGQCRSRLA